MTHEDKRNGTTTLFAALNTSGGTVIGRLAKRHRHQKFIAFLDREVPADRPIHVVLAHKHPAKPFQAVPVQFPRRRNEISRKLPAVTPVRPPCPKRKPAIQPCRRANSAGR